jgi:predicted MFS family arabinose efflux permease
MPSTAVQIFLVLLAAYFLSYFFRATNAVIAPDLQQELGLTPADLGLMTSLFFVTFALAQLPLGPLLDRYGPRFVNPALMLIGAGGALIFAFAQDFTELGIGRALMGLGFAAVYTGALKAFSLWFPPGRYATVVSLYVGIGATGALAAAAPLAWIKELVGWRGVFEWGALVIALVAVLVAVVVRNSPPDTQLPRGGGAVSASQIWRSSAFWRMSGLVFVVGGGFLAWQTLWGGDFLFKVHGLGSLDVGVILLVFSMAAILGFLTCGPLSERLGVSRVMLVAGGIFTLGPALLGLWTQMPIPAVYVIYALMGYFGAFNILMQVQARLVFPTELTGRAVTSINFMLFMGVFLLQWGIGLVLGAWGYSAALLAWALLLALAVAAYAPLALREWSVTK